MRDPYFLLDLMTSILTNSAAISALQILRTVGDNLSEEQSKVASGMRVAAASDNAAYWSISTTMKSDAMAMEAVHDSIGLASAIVDTAYAGMEIVQKSLVEIRDILIMAANLPAAPLTEPVIPRFYPDQDFRKSDLAKLDDRVQQLIDQMGSAIRGASFAGVNMLNYPRDPAVKASEYNYTFVTGYAEGAVQTTKIKAMDIALINDDMGTFPTTTPFDFNPEQGLFDDASLIAPAGSPVWVGLHWFNWGMDNIITGESKTADLDEVFFIQHMENQVFRNGIDRQAMYDSAVDLLEEKLQGMTSRMAMLGAVQNSLETYEELNRSQIDSVNSGVGRLVDADMNEASSRLKALETQQQLAVQSLLIANAAPDTLLQLFR